MTVAALYVERDGPYAGLDDVEVWDEVRDARTYAGPHPVVAHPPCQRWSVMAALSAAQGFIEIGADGGCFAKALASVRRFGGVLEHPALSFAWSRFGLLKPPSGGGWVAADWEGGWTCSVAQGRYGHHAPKQTWLYAVGVDLPSLDWGKSDAVGRIKHSDNRRGYSRSTPMADRALAASTPAPFRNLLLSMAWSAHGRPNRA